MPGFFDKILGKDVESKVKSIQYLGNMDSAGSVPKLVKALDDEAVEVRRAASLALGQHSATGDRNAVTALVKALGDADAGVRMNAALSLGDFVAGLKSAGDGDAVKKALVGLLDREADPGVIKNAVISLANIQDTALIGPMAGALKPKGHQMITMAIDAINDLPPTSVRLEMKKALRSVL